MVIEIIEDSPKFEELTLEQKKTKKTKEYTGVFEQCIQKLYEAYDEYKEESFIVKDQDLEYMLEQMIEEHVDLINYNMELIVQIRRKLKWLQERGDIQ